MWPAPKLQSSTRTSTPLRGGAGYLRSTASRSSIPSEARTRASAITDDAKQQLQSLDSETDSIWRERARLIADVNKLADSLSSLARDAADRFPAEVEDGEQPAPALAEPAAELANRDLPSQEPQDV